MTQVCPAAAALRALA